MAIRLLSFDFFQALADAKGRGEGVTGVDGVEGMFLVNAGEQIVTVEFEGTEYLGVARGGNPNDVDFQLTASEEVWDELLRSGAGGQIGQWVGQGGRIELETPDAASEDLFRRALPIIEDFFGRTRQVEVDPA